MRVPLTIGDFLERAALVFPEREALVDEPLDFFGDRADLSIVATRGHDERVKGIDE